jgi:hypothetical protein
VEGGRNEMEAVVLFKNKYIIKTYSQSREGCFVPVEPWKSLSALGHEMTLLSLIKGLGTPI